MLIACQNLGTDDEKTLVPKKLDTLLRVKDVQQALARVKASGGLKAFVKTGAKHEKVLCGLVKTVSVLDGAEELSEPLQSTFAEWATTINLESYKKGFQELKSECVTMVKDSLTEASQKMREALKIGSKQTWKEGVSENVSWQELSKLSQPILEPSTAERVTDSFATLSEDHLAHGIILTFELFLLFP